MTQERAIRSKKRTWWILGRVAAQERPRRARASSRSLCARTRRVRRGAARSRSALPFSDDRLIRGNYLAHYGASFHLIGLSFVPGLSRLGPCPLVNSTLLNDRELA
jgi:hypothetical protein